MFNVCQHNDIAVGHKDIMGDEVIGTISCETKCYVNGVPVARNWDVVHFPSHPHEMIDGWPAAYRTHDVPVTGTWKLIVVWEHVARHGDVIPVADEAWPNATMVSSQFILQTT